MNYQIFYSLQSFYETKIESIKRVVPMKPVKPVILQIEDYKETSGQFLHDVINGLTQTAKFLPMKYAYDEEGSKIYSQVLGLSQQEPFLQQTKIVQENSQELVNIFGQEPYNLVDIGSGDGAKTQMLIQVAVRMKHQFRYIPIDISQFYNTMLSQRINKRFPQVEIVALTSQFKKGLQWVQSNGLNKNVYVVFGSTIGNQPQQKIQQFVELLFKSSNKNDIFCLSFSLWRDPNKIMMPYQSKPAYKMILNLLARVNRQLNANFNLANFYPYTYFDVSTNYARGLMLSSEDQKIKVGQNQINLKKGEAISSFMSKKFLESEIEALFDSSKFEKVRMFKNIEQSFCLLVIKRL